MARNPALPEDGNGLFVDESGDLVLTHRSTKKQTFKKDGDITAVKNVNCVDLVASGNVTGTIDQSILDPANMTSGSATIGQYPAADGAAGITWIDPCIDGPSSSTDNGIVRWDGTGGDAAQDSLVTIDDTDNIVVPATGSISAVGSGSQSEKFGATAAATGNDAVALGYGADAGANNNAVVIGSGASASSADTVAIGYGADATGTISSAVGSGATATGASSLAVGNGATATPDYCTVIGTAAAIAAGEYSTAVGHWAVCGGDTSVAIGRGANSGAYANNTVIGQNTSATGASVAVLGQSATSTAEGTVIGKGATGSATAPIAIGFSTNTSANHGICIGYDADCAYADAIALGRTAVATAANRCTIGRASSNEIELQVTKGFAAFGGTPPGSQPTKISDPSGGATVDAESRTAINAILDVLEGAGLAAAS